MKNNLFILIKNNLINTFKIKSTSKKKMVLMSIFIIYIVACLMTTLGMSFNNIFKTLKAANLGNYFIPMVFILSSLCSFAFSIYSAKAGLFESKDNDLLLSFPLKKSTVLASRVIYLVLYNFVINLLILLPGILIYITNMQVDVTFYFICVLLVLFSPIIPTIFSCLFGYLVAVLISKTRAKNLFEWIFNLMFLGAYFGLYFGLGGITEKIVSNPTLFNNILKYVFTPVYLVSNAIFKSNILYMLGFILINLAVFILFVYILGNWYFKLISRLSSHKVKSNYHMHNINTNSKNRALLKKELKRYFSSVIYVFNTAVGPVILVVAGAASLFYSKDVLLKLASIKSDMSTSFLVYIALLFCVVLTNTTSASISIEGNNFWILKSFPIEVKDIFKCKIMVNIIIMVPAIIISLILFSISGYITLIEMLLLMLFGILSSLVIAIYGLIINLRLPLFTAVSDQVVVKKSASVFVGTIVPMFIVIFLIPFLVGLQVETTLVMGISVVVVVVLLTILMLVLYKWGIKRFKELS